MDQRDRRLAELGLTDLCAYRAFLTSSPTEWARLAMCRIPISRFYRDRGAFDIYALLLENERRRRHANQRQIESPKFACMPGYGDVAQRLR
jgi:chemotaxis methyl-accepting protein methylase